MAEASKSPQNLHSDSLNAPSTPPPVPETEPSLPDVAQPAKVLQEERRGRAAKFSPAEDLILMREVAAARAHVAGFGEKRARFTIAAGKCNENPNLREKVSWKSVQDRYKRLESTYSKADNWRKKATGLGGESSEIEELLSIMREAKNDFLGKKIEEKAAKAAVDAEKEQAGLDLVAVATKRKHKDDGTDSLESASPKKMRTASSKPDGELASFGKYLHDADLARIELEREKLNLERERLANEREDRKQEREMNAKHELEKMKILVSALTKKE